MSSLYKKNVALTGACVFLITLAGSSLAEEEGALGMKLGSGSRLLLSLGVTSRYVSNYYYQSEDEESAVGLVVRPSALLTTDKGALRYELSALAEAAAFNLDGDADDYVDGTLGAKFDWQPLTRHFLSGSVAWRADHDPFGTRRTESPLLAERKLDRWEQPIASMLYRFGAPQAKLNLEAEVKTAGREYTTNRDVTRFLDFDATALRGTAFYNISSKTSLVAEVIGVDIDYDDVAPGFASRAGEAVHYRVGARWFATGKTRGDVRIGRVERDFDSPAQQDYEEFDWEAGVAWEPKARDRVTFATGRALEESYLNAASLIENDYYRLGWEHDWSSLVKTSVRYSSEDLDFRGIARQDDLEQWAFNIEYKPARHWSLFGDIALQERESNAPLRDFDNTVISAGIRLNY